MLFKGEKRFFRKNVIKGRSLEIKTAEWEDAGLTSPHGHVQPQLHIEQLCLTVT